MALLLMMGSLALSFREIQISINALSSLHEPMVLSNIGRRRRGNVVQVPDLWGEITAPGTNSSTLVEALWMSLVEVMPETLAALESTLQEAVVLEEDDACPSLLYIFDTDTGEPLFYRGLPPFDVGDCPPHRSALLNMLPATVRDLYTVHDGWYLIPSRSAGHLSMAEWIFLSDDTWRLEQHRVEQLPVDPAGVLIVYSHGGDGYLGFELPRPGESGPTVLFELWSGDVTHPMWVSIFG